MLDHILILGMNPFDDPLKVRNEVVGALVVESFTRPSMIKKPFPDLRALALLEVLAMTQFMELLGAAWLCVFIAVKPHREILNRKFTHHPIYLVDLRPKEAKRHLDLITRSEVKGDRIELVDKLGWIGIHVPVE